MLDNRATPYYYGLFADDVASGRVKVCQEILMEMDRIEELIRNPAYYYDDKAIDGYIAFCNNELTLTDGRDLELLPTFKLWAEEVFGWCYFIERRVPVPDGLGGTKYVKKRIKRRLINKQYLIVTRGNAKSVYDATIHGYFLNIDTTATHQIATAPTMRQADETLSPLRVAINRARGPLFQFLTAGSLQNTTGDKFNRCKLASTKKGIENTLTSSLLEIRPMNINKLQGLRCKICTVDEWLSGDTREDVIGALEQGASKIDDWLIVCTSSEGTIRNGVGDDIKMELQKILKGEYKNPHVSIWYYKLDDIKEIADPDNWIKACPNIGITVSYETYALDVERAEKAPAARNDILAKRFNLPLEGYTFYFTYDETIPHRFRSYRKMACSLGIDLSRGDDFCAFTLLFPLVDGSFGIKCRSYVSSNSYYRLPLSRRQKYDEFIREGSLQVLEGVYLDNIEVYEDLADWLDENEYDVRCVGYDPFNADSFIERWKQENSPSGYGVEVVRQGSRTESVPLGEIKDLARERMLLFDEEIMMWTMGNAITITDTNGNRKLYKQRLEEKIDNVAALLDALVAYKLNPQEF